MISVGWGCAGVGGLSCEMGGVCECVCVCGREGGLGVMVLSVLASKHRMTLLLLLLILILLLLLFLLFLLLLPAPTTTTTQRLAKASKTLHEIHSVVIAMVQARDNLTIFPVTVVSASRSLSVCV